MNKYKLNLSERSVKQVPDMEKPGPEPKRHPYSYYEKTFYHSSHPFRDASDEYSHDQVIYEEWHERTIAYNLHLASLNPNPIFIEGQIPFHWKDGDVLGDEDIDVDFDYTKGTGAPLVVRPISKKVDEKFMPEPSDELQEAKKEIERLKKLALELHEIEFYTAVPKEASEEQTNILYEKSKQKFKKKNNL